jgi:hypothetical protein
MYTLQMGVLCLQLRRSILSSRRLSSVYTTRFSSRHFARINSPQYNYKQQVHIFARMISCSVYSLALVTGVTGADLDTGTFEYLLNKDVNFIRQAYPAPNDKGVPKYYALFGPTIVSSAITNELSLIVGPTPDAAYYVELALLLLSRINYHYCFWADVAGGQL